MTDLPAGWEWSTLGKVGAYLNGRGFKKSEWREAGRPIIRIQNLTGSGEAYNYYDGAAEERHVVRDGDLLVSWAATLGVYVWRGPEAVLNQHIFKVRSHVDPAFHRYLLTYVLDDLLRQTHGSGMVHITKGRFDDTPILVPPLAEQERIVAAIEERLSRLEAAETTVRRTHELMRTLADRLIESELSDFKDLRKLADFATPAGITDGPFGSKLKSSHNTESGPRVIRLTNIGVGTFVDEETHISPTYFEELRRHEVCAGDLVVASLVSERVRACIVPQTIGPAIVKADCIRIRPNADTDVRFLNYSLMSRSLDDFVAERIRGVGRSRLGLGNVRDIPVPDAPPHEQRSLADRLDHQLELLATSRATTARAIASEPALRRSILAAAFSGQLVPQDPADEPASVLLQRIRAEREAQPRIGRARKVTS